jgi:hypothetical protein
MIDIEELDSSGFYCIWTLMEATLIVEGYSVYTVQYQRLALLNEVFPSDELLSTISGDDRNILLLLFSGIIC